MMRIDKRWVLWTLFFALECALLRHTIQPVPETLPPLEEWRRITLGSALASTAAVILSLVTWRMRWSMRPKLLRVVTVILAVVGLAVTCLEWTRVFAYTTQLQNQARSSGPHAGQQI